MVPRDSGVGRCAVTEELLVIPGRPKRGEPDCVCGIANANVAGGAQRERQGWRESIGFTPRPIPGSIADEAGDGPGMTRNPDGACL